MLKNNTINNEEKSGQIKIYMDVVLFFNVIVITHSVYLFAFYICFCVSL